ncbi:hypothetical protein DB346_11470 [Verrucomicrobia bacterium LW23]|nr:hypothetical protein DB346_11470 [Verrucomicrobia bacterium LW23]
MSHITPTDAQVLGDPHVVRLAYFDGVGNVTLSRGPVEEMRAFVTRALDFAWDIGETLGLGTPERMDIFCRAHRGLLLLSGQRIGGVLVAAESELLRDEPMPQLTSIAPQTGTIAYDRNGNLLSQRLPPVFEESRTAPVGAQLAALFAGMHTLDFNFTDFILTCDNGRLYARNWLQGYLCVLCLHELPIIAPGEPAAAEPEPEPAAAEPSRVVIYRGRVVSSQSGELRMPAQPGSDRLELAAQSTPALPAADPSSSEAPADSSRVVIYRGRVVSPSAGLQPPAPPSVAAPTPPEQKPPSTQTRAPLQLPLELPTVAAPETRPPSDRLRLPLQLPENR